MNSRISISTLCLALAATALPLSLERPAIAFETPIGTCQTNRNVMRVYSENGTIKVRATERGTNITWLNAPATRESNPEVTTYRVIRGAQPVRVSFYRNGRDCYSVIGNRTERGTVIAVGGGGVSAAQAEQACLNRARQLGYRIFEQSAAQPNPTGYTMAMKGIFNGQQIPLRCTFVSQTRGVTIEQLGFGDAPGRTFYGIPEYGTVRALATGYNDAPQQQRRYFRVQLSNGSTTTWYAKCRTEDQIYDARSRYLGYDRNARAMLSYVCSLRPTVPPKQPR